MARQENNHYGACLHEEWLPQDVSLQEESLRECSDLFKVLGDPTRLSIICMLFDTERCVHELSRLVVMSQSAVSHQLRILRQARLVRHRRAGKHTWYALADDHIRSIVAVAIEHVQEQDRPVLSDTWEGTVQ